MWHSIRNFVWLSQNGSAVLGFALGAPFVLFVFIGFLELSNVSITSTIQQTRQHFFLKNESVSEGQENRPLSNLELIDVDVFTTKGSNWNLWRTKE